MSHDGLQVDITGLGLWLPGYPSAEAWARGERDDSEPKPVGHAFARSIRRRAGGLGRAIADAAAEAMTQAAVDPATIATVVGSSIGEASIMIGLLEGMWRTKTPMSPAAFTVSVHNAASGLLSISQHNRGFTTSIAADHDTPAAALLEGAAIVATEDRPAVIVCADEAAPSDLIKESPVWDLCAAAMVLAPAGTANALARIQLPCAAAPTLSPAEVGERLVHSPQVGLIDLIDAVLRKHTGVLRLDRGLGRGACVELAAPSPATP